MINVSKNKLKSVILCIILSHLSDTHLLQAVEEIRKGLVEANLGGHLYKKRVATATKGKSGGFRTLLAYKKGQVVFFLYGFEKGQRENISNKEKEDLKNAAEVYLAFDEETIQSAINMGSLIEVKNA